MAMLFNDSIITSKTEYYKVLPLCDKNHLMEEMGKGKVWAKGSGATGCLLDGSLEDSKEFLAL